MVLQDRQPSKTVTINDRFYPAYDRISDTHRFPTTLFMIIDSTFMVLTITKMSPIFRLRRPPERRTNHYPVKKSQVLPTQQHQKFQVDRHLVRNTNLCIPGKSQLLMAHQYQKLHMTSHPVRHTPQHPKKNRLLPDYRLRAN